MDCLTIQMPNPTATAEDNTVGAARDDATKLRRVLVGDGVAKFSAALLLAIFRGPGGVFLRDRLLFDAYYWILAAVAAFGAMEVPTGFWVAGNPRRRRGKGKVVICASAVPSVIVAALGGFAVLK
ncbi:hypothetical protein BRADI_5g20000v3 [Brachypodium distachyon]|uniref:Uncharacterized protein n=1 Tax=Brachypodium distachyon TaxID=15368 RepID=I1J166_BRADI|nr:hypothetical protein BRADI_5g20000v3 [Brachypodium distachyon]